VGVADVADAKSGKGGHYKIQRGEVCMPFEKEEDTKEYNKHLQTCIAEMHKNVYGDLAWLKRHHPYNREQNICVACRFVFIFYLIWKRYATYACASY